MGRGYASEMVFCLGEIPSALGSFVTLWGEALPLREMLLRNTGLRAVGSEHLATTGFNPLHTKSRQTGVP